MVKKYFKALLFDWRKKRAIKKARNKALQNGKKYLVLVFHSKPVVVSMQGIKQMIRQHRFSKDFTPEIALKIAIYIAYPHHKN